MASSTSRFWTFWFGLVATLLLAAVPQSAVAGNGKNELAIIVASGSPISELSFYELKLMYKGDRVAQPGGKPLVALNRGVHSPDRIGFDRTVLGMSPQEVARYWIDRKIRGQSGAPKAIDPAQLVAKVVARLDGAVSYVPMSAVTNEVKVVAIDGKKPGSEGYPIAY